MKRTVVLLLMFHWGMSYAQEGLRTGLRFGLGETNFTSADASDRISGSSGKVLFQGGLTASYDFLPWISMQGDLLVSGFGGKMSGADHPGGLFGSEQAFVQTYNLTFLQLPILPTIKWSNDKWNLYVYAGPAFNFKLGANYSKEYDDKDINENYGFERKRIASRIDATHIAIVTGLGIDFRISENGIFFFDLRTNRFSDGAIGLIPDANEELKSVGLQYFSLGFGTRYIL